MLLDIRKSVFFPKLKINNDLSKISRFYVFRLSSELTAHSELNCVHTIWILNSLIDPPDYGRIIVNVPDYVFSQNKLIFVFQHRLGLKVTGFIYDYDR